MEDYKTLEFDEDWNKTENKEDCEIEVIKDKNGYILKKNGNQYHFSEEECIEKLKEYGAPEDIKGILIA